MSVDFLQRIQNVSEVQPRHITCLFWGETKMGKTHMISTFPGPILVLAIGFEHASYPTLKAAGRTDIDILDVTAKEGHPETGVSMEEVVDNLGSIIAEKGYQTIALDTTTNYTKLFIQWYTNFGARKMDWDGYRDLYMHMQYLVDKFHNAPINMIWTAHSGYEKSEEVILAISPELPGAVRGLLQGSCNIVGYMDRDYVEKEVDGKPKKVPRYKMYIANPPGRYPPLAVGTHFDEAFGGGYVIYPSFKSLAKYLAPEGGPALIKI